MQADAKRHKPAAGGAQGLGDIMGGSVPPGMLSALSAFTPLQRVVLSANGNLQRLISSYYNSPATVKCNRHECTSPGEYSREVEISVHDTIFCVARSTVSITAPKAKKAIEAGVAIGQLFRHLNVLPSFALRGAGAVEAGSHTDPILGEVDTFWREYSLEGEGVLCIITEVLRSDVFDLKPAAGLASDAPAAKGAFGDIMSPNVTGIKLPDGFTPKQRLLLTANGNIQRIISSYFAAPVTLYVMSSHKRHESPVYDRQVAGLIMGKEFMLAKSTIYLTDPELVRMVEDQKVSLGQLFREIGVLPTFTLHSAGIGDTFFWRTYQLSAAGMTCEINETFSTDVFDRYDVFSSPREGSELFFF